MDNLLLSIREKLDKFENRIESPRLYVANEITFLKNEIDIAAELLLKKSNENKAYTSVQISMIQDEINLNRKIMLDEVEAYENNIFATLTTNTLDEDFVNKMTLSMEACKNKLMDFSGQSEESLLNLEYSIDISIYEFDCKIKKKQSLIFFPLNELKQLIYQNKHKSFKNDADILRNHRYRVKNQLAEYQLIDNFFESPSTNFGYMYAFNDCVTKEILM